jgi:radical SAM protein with 4Fe4S-binding SPASM domain
MPCKGHVATNSCTEGVDLSVFEFTKWPASSNNATIPFVFKDMFYLRIKLVMLLLTCQGCSYRTICSGRCSKVYSEQKVWL